MAPKEAKNESFLKTLLSNAGIVIGVTSLVVGLVQYKKAQDWKKSEFAARQLEMLHTEPMLMIATKALEWKKRDFPMPAQYQGIYNTKTFHHSSADMERAMAPGTEEKQDVDMMEALYPDIFDKFFDHLKRMDHYIDVELFTIEDIDEVCYWVDRVENPEFVEKKDLFKTYLKAYGYEAVLKLMKRCGELEAKRSVGKSD